MKRRTVLRTAAMLPLLSASLGPMLSSSAKDAKATKRPAQRVRPSDPAWPSAAKWAKLKEDVGGNLIEVRPLFGSCESQPEAAACRDTLDHISNPLWIGDQPAGTEVSGWLDAWTPAPSIYAVKARNAADVAAAVLFARDNKLRLAVKGGSHSYLGTSNAPDSLLVWTRGMNRVTVHDAFVGKGCEGHATPVPAVSAEAGAVWMDLYNAVTTEAGRYVQGGGCTTVGVAGLVQSGGFGSFSKGFGTAASGLLEAEIVTADGQVRIVNACSDPDLFWALRGGGGGTFGVVTRLTLQTHELPKFFGGAHFRICANSDAAFQRLITRFVGFYREHLLNPHWGEQVKLSPGLDFEISMLSQGLDHNEIDDTWRPFKEWVEGLPQDYLVTSPLQTYAAGARRWWNVDANPGLIRDTREGARKGHGWWRDDQGQVGAFIHGFESLWLPESLLDPSRQEQLAAALCAASAVWQVQLHINKGLAGAPPEARAAARQTATNPAVADAFTLVIIANGGLPAYPGLARPPMDAAAARNEAHAIDLAAVELRKVAPNSGSYVSESNYFNGSWQQEYWGANYQKLRSVKRRYDPDGLFVVHHGVGSEDWSADGFTRLS
jgi:FAD/FMN-containing dehydrogenase